MEILKNMRGRAALPGIRSRGWVMVLAFSLVATSMLALIAGCEALMVGPEPASDPASVFDQFANEFELRSPLFTVHPEVKWDSLRSYYRSKISAGMPDSSLAQLMDSLAGTLNDGQFVLNAAGRLYTGTAPPAPKLPSDFATVSTYYLANQGQALSPSGNLFYGTIHDTTGYIRIETFDTSGNGFGFNRQMATVVAAMLNLSGIVIDIRGNRGRSAAAMLSIVGHFAQYRRNFAFGQVRTSANRLALTRPSGWRLGPARPVYQNAIMVLTDRGTLSAGGMFAMALKGLWNVKVIGDTTGTGFSERLDRELSNGWLYSLSTQKVSDANFVCYEGFGLPPDIEVNPPPGTPIFARDTVLQKALDVLAGK